MFFLQLALLKITVQKYVTLDKITQKAKTLTARAP